jgi:hypothetical protein
LNNAIAQPPGMVLTPDAPYLAPALLSPFSQSP